MSSVSKVSVHFWFLSLAFAFAQIPGTSLYAKPSSAVRAPAAGTVVSRDHVSRRIDWLKAQPRKQIRNEQNGAMYNIYLSGMPVDAEVVELRSDTSFFHLTNAEAARKIVQSQKMIAGRTPYIRADDAGGELFYFNYVDLTGVFATDRMASSKEVGFTGAAGASTYLRVTLPRGLKILKLASASEELPFYLIPMQTGDAFALKVELIGQ